MRSKDAGLLDRLAEYIFEWQRGGGESPTQAEVMKDLRLTAPTVHRYLHELERLGRIEFNANGTIKTPDILAAADYNQIPLIGEVRCGDPTMAIEEFDDMFKIPRRFTGSGEFFMLRAKGDSMSGAGIAEGDYVVIRRTNAADIGDIVVAFKAGVDEGESTLKRWRRDNGRYYLHPENEAYEDIDATGFQIVGVLVGLYRRF
jgi:repressor LexA